MKKEKLVIYEKACELLGERGHEAQVRNDYSGRAMYGNTCVAIVTSANGAMVGWAIACAAHEAGEEPHECEAMIPRREDQMGKEQIYY